MCVCFLIKWSEETCKEKRRNVGALEKEGMRLNILVVVLIVGWLSETESVVDVDTVDENFLVESLKRLKVSTLSRDRRSENANI